jgi:C4-type Zn-finger protein
LFQFFCMCFYRQNGLNYRGEQEQQQIPNNIKFQKKFSKKVLKKSSQNSTPLTRVPE